MEGRAHVRLLLTLGCALHCAALCFVAHWGALRRPLLLLTRALACARLPLQGARRGSSRAAAAAAALATRGGSCCGS